MRFKAILVRLESNLSQRVAQCTSEDRGVTVDQRLADLPALERLRLVREAFTGTEEYDDV